MASPSEIAIWAKGIGLAYCVGAEFNAEKGRLPVTLEELVTWGNGTGRRDSAGNWMCKGSGGIVPIPIIGDGDFMAQIIAWARNNPILAAGGAIVAIMLLKRR